MINLEITTSLLGVGLAAIILLLLRRDHLYLLHGVFWIAIAVLAAILGIWPGLIDKMAGMLGINYPPAFMFLINLIVLFLKILHTDITNTKIEKNIKRLNQRIAMLDQSLINKNKI